MPSHDTDDAGSFSTGFTLGLFAGAAGFFLFATRDGERVRARLTQEWTQAKQRILDEVGEDGAPVSLQDLAAAAKKHIFSVLDGMATQHQRARGAKTADSAKETKNARETKDAKDATDGVSKRTAKKKRLFKGVS